ncbi:MAG: MogA/MoaB family molybdenum cofactor biosynthesis protein [Thermaerobacter sp.]|nr:MogA/MoaB family molybdenum cofactor biosynthesis protein [Thermaerobacter sp.]
MQWRIAVLTSSDAGAAGERQDVSGAILRDAAEKMGTVQASCVLPDDYERLRQQILQWVEAGIDLVVTTGGTGIGPRDVMPEVTASLAERLLPGLAEAMRAESLRHTPFGMLSRGLAAVRGQCLIVNFPGSPRAVQQLIPVVFPVLPHALALIHGQTAHEKPPDN